MWAEEVTDVRKKIDRKSRNYKEYTEPAVEVEVEEKSRRSVPHSTRRSNPEGLLELQIKARTQLDAGVSSKFKKRHLKELPVSTREKIVKMYMEDHVFQSDIAKYFKISAILVGRLVKEAQEDPEKNTLLKARRQVEIERQEAVKKVVKGLLTNCIPIVKAEVVAQLVRD